MLNCENLSLEDKRTVCNHRFVKYLFSDTNIPWFRVVFPGEESPMQKTDGDDLIGYNQISSEFIMFKDGVVDEERKAKLKNIPTKVVKEELVPEPLHSNEKHWSECVVNWSDDDDDSEYTKTRLMDGVDEKRSKRLEEILRQQFERKAHVKDANRAVSDLFSKMDKLDCMSDVKHIVDHVNFYWERRQKHIAEQERIERENAPIDEDDVKLIVKQVEGVTEDQARSALKLCYGDLVNTIIKLTGM